MNRYLVPIGGLVTVLIMGVVLILVVTIRPWGGANGGWDTHLNFRDDVQSDYSRTTVTYVDTQPGKPEGWKEAAKVDGEPVGYPIFVSKGCASCHGLEGEGGAVGPPIAGAFPQVVSATVRLGPDGMPAYSEDDLSVDDLDAIIEYLQSIAQSPGEVDTQPGKPKDQKEAAKANGEPVGYSIFVSQGCSACHGLEGEGGVGPPIAGAFPQVVSATVRLGPDGMPAYSEDDLSVDDLDAIIEYLQSIAQSPGE